MPKSREEIEKEIINFLDEGSSKRGDFKARCCIKHGIACAFATMEGDHPRVTPVDFFNEGLTLWIGAEPGGKIPNIKKNPNVGIGIYSPVDHSKVNRSLQIWGKASLMSRSSNEKEFMERMEKWGMLETVRHMIDERVKQGLTSEDKKEETIIKFLNVFNLIKVEPLKIVYLYIHPETGREKHIWTRDSCK